MEGVLPETISIYEKLLSDEQKRIIREFLKEVQTKKEKYETKDLWLMDQKIGGIGGYCMPGVNSTLGKAAHEISKMNVFDDVIIESLLEFVTLYNKAKHEVNMLAERPRMFSVEDAIVCYFSARIIGQAILTELKYSLSLDTYEINNEAFNF